MVGPTDLARGRAAALELDWGEAYGALIRADRTSALGVEDLELLGVASFLLYEIDGCTSALQRASQLHLESGDNRRAARCLFWLGFTLLNEGEHAQGGGWLARAARILEAEEEECAEHGYLMLTTAYEHVAMAGEYEVGRAIAARVADIARRVGDTDLMTMSLNIQGRSLIREGEVRAGLTLLDEAMVAVISGELSPYVAGSVYCSLIEVCHEISELGRAYEWTDALSTWCTTQRGMVAFTGECIIHRAEMLQQRGNWPGAVEEANLVFDRSIDSTDRYAAGEARYRIAEVHRSRGEFKQAEEAYHRASEIGREPQPGLALLLLAKGKPDAAASMIRRVVAATDDDLERARLLPALVEILIDSGSIDEARDATAELETISGVFRTSVFEARADRAMGELLLAVGEAESALIRLRRAWRVWRDMGLPYEEARVRVLVARACHDIGDHDTASLEMEAARQVFSRLDARPDLARVEALVGGGGAAANQHGLTARELEVLRLVATGMTNQGVADDLVLAVKTVDRHVSNIFHQAWSLLPLGGNRIRLPTPAGLASYGKTPTSSRFEVWGI